MQDVVLPLANDRRLPSDTLFLVFEADYRFYPQGEDPDASDTYGDRLEALQEKRKRSRSPNKIRQPTGGQASSSSAGAYRPDLGSPQEGKRVVSALHYTPQRGSTDRDDVNDGLSSNVADLLRMATFCHRQQMGHIIWFGWCSASNGTHPSWPVQASHGLMVSKTGALAIAAAMHTQKVIPGYIDLILLWWLRKDGEAQRVQASYLYPSVGAFGAHPSECDPVKFGADQGGRPDGWVRRGCSKGSRTAEDALGRGKYVVQWSGTGQDGNRERLWLPFPKDPILHTAEFRWKSYKQVEPTASSQQHPPAAPKPKLTARANRVKRQWESREDMRTFVTSHLEVALPFLVHSRLTNPHQSS